MFDSKRTPENKLESGWVDVAARWLLSFLVLTFGLLTSGVHRRSAPGDHWIEPVAIRPSILIAFALSVGVLFLAGKWRIGFPLWLAIASIAAFSAYAIKLLGLPGLADLAANVMAAVGAVVLSFGICRTRRIGGSLVQ